MSVRTLEWDMRKTHSELTADGQKHDRDGNGCLEAGQWLPVRKLA